MKIVRIVKDWKESDIFRQTPNGDGVWDGIKFTFDPVLNCDYLIVWNRPPYEIKINCLEGGKIIVAGEPPTRLHKPYLKAYKHFDVAFSQYATSKAVKHIVSHGALPWHINKSYEELISLGPEIKNEKRIISCISSNFTKLTGHVDRLKFLTFLKESGFEFDLFGRGINPVDDKFDALYPYKYSIAIENSSYPHYWTEKIADCFLSWTMPIYYGCSNITSYFPSEALIIIDVKKPKEALEIIKEAIAEERWTKNLSALEDARNLILNKYQFFPKMAEYIGMADKEGRGKKEYYIPPYPGFWEHKPTVFERIKGKISFGTSW